MPKKASYSVYWEMDRAVFRFGGNDIFIPYAQVFKIAQIIRVACKRARAIIHESESWIDLATDKNLVVEPYSSTWSGRQCKEKFDWEVSMNNELLYLRFSDLVIHLHFVDALRLSQSLRAAGKLAKAWAGDMNRHKNLTGMLTDAEENYRLGI